MNEQNANQIKDIEPVDVPPSRGADITVSEMPREEQTTRNLPEVVVEGGAGSPEEVGDNQEVARRGRGRPPGAKNKATLFKELMTGRFESKAIADIEKVYEVLFAEAHGGNMKAIKMVLDRVVPVTKAVDMDQMKGGINVQVFVGSMEESREAEVVEDAEFEEVE